MTITKLNLFNSSDFDKGASKFKITLWYFVNTFLVASKLVPFMSIKYFILKIFGAKIGKGLVLKPDVNIKFPWKLDIGDNCWIGANTVVCSGGCV